MIYLRILLTGVCFAGDTLQDAADFVQQIDSDEFFVALTKQLENSSLRPARDIVAADLAKDSLSVRRSLASKLEDRCKAVQGSQSSVM